ncbi:hypothetical protein KHA93_00625 [Bacillus sp. FJAT-49732]|uniref:Uncharacterized protein n=1 Tax=Lederbergia citrisecunda TaxID=2833583 RepID=A0A942TK70_9BACI|nr:hypothetical protein [Lederbergia citrisecunda]MBS4198162.1 hypothetical protein [Lederbergia citrisecunda]
MIRSKTMLLLALVLFIASIVLNFPFPHSDPYGETIASELNIPTKSANGWYYVGFASLLLFISSLFFLSNSLNKYHGRIILLAIVVVMFAPPMIASTFQKAFATGIYAVSYESNLSNCHFEMLDETTLRGECVLPFENYSKNEVQFSVEFYEKYFIEDDVLMVTLLNNHAPYEVMLKGYERRNVKIESNIDVSNLENYVENGDTSGMNIIIKSGEKMRKL